MEYHDVLPNISLSRMSVYSGAGTLWANKAWGGGGQAVDHKQCLPPPPPQKKKKKFVSERSGTTECLCIRFGLEEEHTG